MHSWHARDGRGDPRIVGLRLHHDASPRGLPLPRAARHRRSAALRGLAHAGKRSSTHRRVKILVGMNLSPTWCDALRRQDIEAIHWSQVGDPRATDPQLAEWAMANGYAVFTHDLDFSTALATTQAHGPSIIQVRSQDAMPAAMEHVLVTALRLYENEVLAGAIVTIDAARSRIRLMPLKNDAQAGVQPG